VTAEKAVRVNAQKINPRDAFVDDAQQTLDKFGVPAAEQAELKAIVAGTRGDIVVESDAAAAR